ncbi:P1 family peptidase [Streptomyces griseomycini]|uniref:D-aminopeptidase n=1 Tax=Streptomyces griseomycini TaxID=66895 RepID=A0A7W7PTY7_9ACTN|nr:P1 family peptidase [Streptomyces griseomycini]MBB4901248.1 D-aminopeptidase [Streptomyces griseomycini]GGQ13373.1 D-aminopeptidase [Streptomyces griseomycini]GGR23329.1 D-aminopeptidase [Streptomyces griseomycini]
MEPPAHPQPAPGTRRRARDLGIVIGQAATGPLNAITDVPGVRVGHTTVRRQPDVHSGVTAVVPDAVGPHAPLPAGVFTGNGYGKLIGTTQLTELGTLETPILLTSTLSAFRVADALVGWMLQRPGCEEVRSLNPVVGECNDGFLSDIRARPVHEEHVRAALDTASGGTVAEGCVGAGTGMVALGFKAGIGTASRTADLGGRCFTTGVLVQANFGGTLRVLGRTVTPQSTGLDAGGPEPVAETGSCMIVVATDAPLDARQLTRVARRAVFALARTGAAYSHGSGDYAVAFGTRPDAGAPVPDAGLGPLFEAVLDGVEEAVLNSLLAATTTTGFGGRTVPALPADLLLAALAAPAVSPAR